MRGAPAHPEYPYQLSRPATAKPDAQELSLLRQIRKLLIQDNGLRLQLFLGINPVGTIISMKTEIGQKSRSQNRHNQAAFNAFTLLFCPHTHTSGAIRIRYAESARK